MKQTQEVFILGHPLRLESQLFRAFPYHLQMIPVANLILLERLDIGAPGSAETGEALRNYLSLINQSNRRWALRISQTLDPEVLKLLLSGRFANLEYLFIGSCAETMDCERVSNLLSIASAFLPQVNALVEIVDTSEIESFLAQEVPVSGFVMVGNEAPLHHSQSSSLVLLQKAVQKNKWKLGIQKEAQKFRILVKGGLGLYSSAAFLGIGVDGLVFDSELFGASGRGGLSESCFAQLQDLSMGDLARHQNRVRPEELRAAFLRQIQAPGELPVELELQVLGKEAFLAPYLSKFTLDNLATRIFEERARALVSQRTRFTFEAESDLARKLGSRLPLVQGPMAWVTESVEFAARVHDEGALPVFATGTMSEEAARKLLEEARSRKGLRFGCGLIGFEDAQRFQRVLGVLKEYQPSVIILAGGRPKQVEEIAQAGLTAFVHVPNPKLLPLFLNRGAFDLIFEGSESGGHVGEISSQLLWETAFHELQGFLSNKGVEASAAARKLNVLLAGGIGSPWASLYAALCSSHLRDQGVNLGLQVGTAYIGTTEALECGIVSEIYQSLLYSSRDTVVIGGGVEHRIRTLPNDVALEIRNLEAQFARGEITREQLREKIGSKIFDGYSIALRKSLRGQAVDTEKQVRDGIFLAGDLTAYLSKDDTLADLHRHLCLNPKSLIGDWPRKKAKREDDRNAYVFLASASHRLELKRKLFKLKEFILARQAACGPSVLEASICEFSRRDFQLRRCMLAIVFPDRDTLLERLDEAVQVVESGPGIHSKGSIHFLDDFSGKLVFLFPGQGSNYPANFRMLANHSRELFAECERASKHLKERFNYDPISDSNRFDASEYELERPEIDWWVQPLMAGLETIFDRFLLGMGAAPAFRLGHSLGEVAAFGDESILSVDEVTDLAAYRGKIMKEHGGRGGMTIVLARLEVVQQVLAILRNPDLHIANFNGPSQFGVAGTEAALRVLEDALKRSRINFIRLQARYPFHTPLMAGAAAEYEKYLRARLQETIAAHPLKARSLLSRLLSNATARTYESSYQELRRLARAGEGDSTNGSGSDLAEERIVTVVATLLAQQICTPVRFQDAVEEAYRQGGRVFVEVGPGKVLSGLARNILKDRGALILPLVEQNSELNSLIEGLSMMIISGHLPNFDKLFVEGGLFTLKGIDENLINALRTEFSDLSSRKRGERPSVFSDDDIVVVGFALQGPASPDAEQYWKNIIEKVDAQREIPRTKWDSRVYYDPDPKAPNRTYGKTGAVSHFQIKDAHKFGIQPNAAREIDRMQIIALQAARSLIEHAGWSPTAYPHRETSVVLGYASPEQLNGDYSSRVYMEYLQWKLRIELDRQGLLESDTARFVREFLGTECGRLPQFTSISAVAALSNMISARVSRYLDLNVPNYVVDSACASSLSALEIAFMQLKSGRARYSICGGLDDFSVGRQLGFSKTLALSMKGRSTPFDAAADGLIQGDGAALLLLTTLGQAKKDARKIYGVIRSVSGSSDGQTTGSLTIPSRDRQILSMTRGLEAAGLKPEDIDFIETHGTGTPLGDVTEISSLNSLFGYLPPEVVAVGSVKANIGHTMVAAGAFSLIKVLQAISHGLIPPMINISKINPSLQIEKTPFYFPKEIEPWYRRSPRVPRRAMVCGYGFGGTNHHAVVEEYLESPAQSRPLQPKLRLISAASPGELEKKLRRALGGTAGLVQEHWNGSHENRDPIRLAVIAATPDELAASLRRVLDHIGKKPIGFREKLSERIVLSDLSKKPAETRLAFVFPGHGSQYPGMARGLYECNPVYREAMDIHLGTFHEFGDWVFENYRRTGEFIIRLQEAPVLDALTTFFLIGAVNMAYYRMLEVAGVRPNAVAGYSSGEYSAFYAAGGVDYANLARIELIGLKGIHRASEKGIHGWMTTVVAEEKDLAPLLAPYGADINLAMRVTDRVQVLTGRASAMEDLEKKLKQRNFSFRSREADYPYHWQLLQEEYGKRIYRIFRKAVTVGRPRIPIFSSLAGVEYSSDFAEMIRNLSSISLMPLDIHGQIRKLAASGINLFVEVGPNKTYSNMISSSLPKGSFHTIAVDADAECGKQWENFLAALAELHASSVNLDPKGLEALGAQFVARDGAPSDVVAAQRPKQELGNWVDGPLRVATTPAGQGARRAQVSKAMPVNHPRTGGQVAMSRKTGSEDVLAQLLEANREALRLALDANLRVLQVLRGSGVMPETLLQEPEVPATFRESAARQYPEEASRDGAKDAPREAPIGGAEEMPEEVEVEESSVTTALIAPAEPITVAAPAPHPVPAGNPAPASAPAEALNIDPAVREKVLEIITAQSGFERSQLADDSRLQIDLGIDSIQQMQIFAEIDQNFKIEIMQHAKTKAVPKTLGQLMSMVTALRKS